MNEIKLNKNDRALLNDNNEIAAFFVPGNEKQNLESDHMMDAMRYITLKQRKNMKKS